MLRVLSQDESRRLRMLFEEAGYTEPNLRKHLGAPELPSRHLRNLPRLLDRTSAPLPVNALLRWFWLARARKRRRGVCRSASRWPAGAAACRRAAGSGGRSLHAARHAFAGRKLSCRVGPSDGDCIAAVLDGPLAESDQQVPRAVRGSPPLSGDAGSGHRQVAS